jgi:hypothetical protein
VLINWIFVQYYLVYYPKYSTLGEMKHKSRHTHASGFLYGTPNYLILNTSINQTNRHHFGKNTHQCPTWISEFDHKVQVQRNGSHFSKDPDQKYNLVPGNKTENL